MGKLKPVAAKKIIGWISEIGVYYNNIGDSLVGIPLMEREIIEIPYITGWMEIGIDSIAPNSVALVTKKPSLRSMMPNMEVEIF